MLIDTHCHIQNIIKKEFDVILAPESRLQAQIIIDQAAEHDVTTIINVGTSLTESLNCVSLAKHFKNVYASVGIHPNDTTDNWQKEIKELALLVADKEKNKIVAIGECGMDFHYPDYNIERQKDSFKAQIELALENDLALVIHTRDAHDETLRVLEEYSKNGLRGTIHCFSEGQTFADLAVAWGFVLGIGGTITYPKNDGLRAVVKQVGLSNIVLETDAPFLPPQVIRGQKNHPLHIATVAHYLATLLNVPFQEVAQTTSSNAIRIFELNNYQN